MIKREWLFLVSNHLGSTMFVRNLSPVLCIALTSLSLFGQYPLVSQDRDEINTQIKRLGNGNFDQREQAVKKLMAAGENALPYLNVASRTEDDPEAVFRIRGLVTAIVDQTKVSKSTNMQLTLIEPGEFVMGSLAEEVDRHQNEEPHKVKMTKFFLMGTKEVTQKEYSDVMDERPSWFSAMGKGRSRVEKFETGVFPVDSVSWYDAIQFCNKLSEKDGVEKFYSVTKINRLSGAITEAKVTIQGGIGYRLPTEAEWEYACRAGTKTPYHFGKRGHGGNFQYIESTGYGRSRSLSLGRTTKTGSFQPNAWGLYDMHGNVAEWCWDWYSQSYYSRSPALNPAGPESGVLSYKVLRGGSFLVKQSSCRSATRYYTVRRGKHYYAGFRVARNLSEIVAETLESQEK